MTSALLAWMTEGDLSAMLCAGAAADGTGRANDPCALASQHDVDQLEQLGSPQSQMNPHGEARQVVSVNDSLSKLQVMLYTCFKASRRSACAVCSFLRRATSSSRVSLGGIADVEAAACI